MAPEAMGVTGASPTPGDPSDALSRAVDDLDVIIEHDANADGDQDADDGDQGTDDGQHAQTRTADQVRGELLRKMEKSEAKITGALQAMQQSMQQSLATFSAHFQPGAQAPAGALPQVSGGGLDSFSLEDLVAAKDKILASGDPRLVLEYQMAVADKTAAAAAQRAMNRATQETRMQDMQAQYAERALRKWGEAGLNDKTSQFYQAVQAEIANRKAAFGFLSPSVILDAANDVGDRMGLTATQGRTPRNGRLAGGRTQAPNTSVDPTDYAKVDTAIASMEQAAGKPFSPEERKRIRDRYKEIMANQNLY